MFRIVILKDKYAPHLHIWDGSQAFNFHFFGNIEETPYLLGHLIGVICEFHHQWCLLLAPIDWFLIVVLQNSYTLFLQESSDSVIIVKHFLSYKIFHAATVAVKENRVLTLFLSNIFLFIIMTLFEMITYSDF